MKGLPPQKTWRERYRPDVQVGPGKLRVGKWTYWFESCRFMTWHPDDAINIAVFSSPLAAGATLICGGHHDEADLATYPFSLMDESPLAPEPVPPSSIFIGNEVWLATDSMVLSPVTIGDGAVVAARSVVTRDVPPVRCCVGGSSEHHQVSVR